MTVRRIAYLALPWLAALAFGAVVSAEAINPASQPVAGNPAARASVQLEDCSLVPFNDGATGVADLIAGQHYDVGDVYFEAYETADGWFLRVTYQTTGDWYLTEFHVYVGENPPDRSAPGLFPYGGEGLDTQEHVVGGIPYYPDANGCVMVAAHAVVESRTTGGFDLDDFAASLPDCAFITGSHPAADLMAYVDLGVTDTSLMGDYYGWCVDTDRRLTGQFEYPANVYSSYEMLPAGLIEFPGNLDLVNWILNQQIVGTPSICGGNFTYGDVQRAIWGLVDDEQADGGLGPWAQCRVDEITGAAFANGEGFTPDCGELVGVILVPVEYCGGPWDFQFFIIGVPAECDVDIGEETAWAKAGAGFDCGWRTGWGSYMQFCFDPVFDRR